MRKTWKKLLKSSMAYGMVCAMLVTSLSVGGGNAAQAAEVGSGVSGSASTKDIVTPDNPMPFDDLTSSEMIADMGVGWNLGNTMDGHKDYNPGETAWQNVKTTKEIIKAVHDKGYNTIRIPVTWGNFINADYSVYEEWMGRVQDIVDYAIAEDMYVMVNIHHDGADNDGNHLGSAEDTSPHGWLDLNGRKSGDQINDEDFAKVKEKFTGLWKTIAERFKNYDEHLLFASMNEVYGAGGWDTTEAVVNQDMKRINDLNQTFVDTVRATGANNAKRWLICPTRNTEISTLLEDKYTFAVPNDTQKRVMVEVHEYGAFGMGAMNSSLDENKSGTKAYQLKALKEKFVDKGVPVVLGEYGLLNNQMPVYHAEGMGYLAKKYQIIPVAWDNNGDDMRILYRDTLEEVKVDGYSITESTMRGYFYDTANSQIVKEPVITALTSFNVSDSEVALAAGESKTVSVTDRAPAESNDVVVWSSADSTIASVYNGKINAKAVGTTTITAASKHDGSVKKEIKVTVTPQSLTTASTGIRTDFDSYEMEAESEAFLNGAAEPTGNGAYVTYQSSDPSIVTVSTLGKLRALKIGEATVTATTSDGISKEIKVTVKEAPAPTDFNVNLALHVMYNYNNSDNTVSYGGTEYGPAINVTKDGTYTLTFDSAKNLSAGATSAGITNLNRVAALYIKDWDVTQNIRRKSPNIAGKIRYTSIKVDGKELLPAETKNYDTLNSGVFDTGNPMNVWRLEDQNVTLNGVTKYTDPNTSGLSWVFDDDDPQVITVTFKLSGFTGPVTEPGSGTATQKPADKLTVAKKAVTIAAGKSASIAYTSSKTPTLSTGNKKIATAKVSGKNIKITVPKKATKGAGTTITVKAGTKTAKIKVTVKNPVKKVKAVKKTVSVKKKKAKKITFKVTATNKKKAVTDTVKATVKSKKVAKVTKTVTKAGKTTVTVKGLKKGKTTLTLKIGKKAAKVTVKVK